MRAGLLALMLLTFIGCDDDDASDAFGGACTEIGCGDEAHITILAPDDSWAGGSYRFELTLGDATHLCTANLPGDFAVPRGSTASLSCQPTLGAWFTPKTMCTETRSADAVSQTCTPITGRWTLEISAPGTPRTLHTRIERDAELLLDEQRELEYSEHRPNGPHCDPLCKQSELSLEL